MDIGGDLAAIFKSIFGPVMGTVVLMAFGLHQWYKSKNNAEQASQNEAREALTAAQEAMFTRLQAEVDRVIATKAALRKERDREHQWSLWHRALAEAHFREARKLWHAYNGMLHKVRILCPDVDFPEYPEPPDLEMAVTRGATRPSDN